MKAVRIVGICVGIIVLLALLALGIGLNSTFQTWAARRAIASRSDLHASIGSLSAGFKQIEIRDLKVEREGMVLTLPLLQAELPLLDAGLSQRVKITRVIAKGWTLDLTHVKSAPVVGLPPAVDATKTAASSSEFSLLSSAQAAEPTPSGPGASSKALAPIFRGVLIGLKLPVDLSLDGVEMSGDLLLADPSSKNPTRFQVTLRGGGLAAGREGSFPIEATGMKPEGETVGLKGTLTAAMDTPRTFTSLGLKADAWARGATFPQGVSLKIITRTARTQSGETYDLVVASEQKSLAELRAEWLTRAAKISGQWKLNLHDSDVAPFAMGKRMPVFEAIGEGSFETGTAFDEVRASGQLNASVSQLEKLRPELSAMGTVRLAADFDVLQHQKALRVERFNAALGGSGPVASVHALQAFEFNLDAEDLQLNVADPAKDLVGLKLDGLPLAWVHPFTGEWEITGGDLRGEFNVSARDGGLALRAVRPSTVEKANIAQAGKPLLQNVDLSLDVSGDYFATRAWQAQIIELGLRQEGRLLLDFAAKAGQQAGPDALIKATGTWRTDLTAWSAQPIAADKLQVSSGKAQGEFSASFDGTKAFEAKVALSDLVAMTKETLPNVSVEARGEIGGNGKITFQAPILFEHAGRKSDLLLTAAIAPGTPVPTLDGRLSSEKLVVEDVQLLALLAAGKAADTERPKESDTEPFWGSIRGQLTLALKRVIYANSFEASDVNGVLRLEANELKLDQIRASLNGEGSLRLNGGVTFSPNAKEAYKFASTVALTNFDTAPAFRALYPERLPTLEAKLNVNGQIAGEGANLAMLSEQAHGRFDVVSKGGVFRALSTVLPADKIEGLQSGLSIVGGLLGGSTGDMLTAASDIVKQLSEIPFDQLSLVTERDSNLNLLLKDFSLISPDVRLGGTGQVSYAPTKRLIDQALDLQLSLRARGRLGDLLGQVKMLKPEKDNLGYVALNAPIKIGGTLGKTESDLGARILSAAAEKTGLGDAINGWLGRGKEKREN